MEFNGVILLIDSNTERKKIIETILDFMSIRWHSGSESDSFAYLNDIEEQTAVLVGDLEGTTLSDVLIKYSKVPFVGINVEHEYSSPNMMGTLKPPFNIEDFSQQLRFCQSFFSLHHAKKNQKNSDETLLKLLVGQGSAIKEVRHLIEQVAVTDANVLILGESGTGKEVVARSIHELSNRSKGPFVPINCGAIPPDLLESELFGHEKGAFTGAISARKGRFEMAENGTIFLDEIGDMPMPMQVKLLRVLQEHYFERVGGNKSVKTNVRVIAATHRHLEEMIRDGKFREDLYYRLNVFPIDTPPLRDRADDIPLLLQELTCRHAVEHNVSIKFTQRAIDSLMKHPWPGNVRELSNLVERLMILHPNCIIDDKDLPVKYQYGVDGEIKHKSSYESSSPMAEKDALMAMFSDETNDDNETVHNENSSDEVSAESVETSQENGTNGTLENKSSGVSTVSDDQTLAGVLPAGGINLKDVLSELEVNLIRQALDKQNGVTSRAAEMLGMRRTTLVEKMKKYGIVAKDF